MSIYSELTQVATMKVNLKAYFAYIFSSAIKMVGWGFLIWSDIVGDKQIRIWSSAGKNVGK